MAALLAYLLGTIPFADLAAWLGSRGSVHLREEGSGNPGGTNVGKTVGKAWGAGVIAADVGKSVTACVASRAIAGTPHIGGPLAVIGHCYPVWNGWRGGKGVACAGGQMWATYTQYIPFAAVSSLGLAQAQSAFLGTAVASGGWVGASYLKYRRGDATIGLPVAALISSVVVLRRFAVAEAAKTAAEVSET